MDGHSTISHENLDIFLYLLHIIPDIPGIFYCVSYNSVKSSDRVFIHNCILITSLLEINKHRVNNGYSSTSDRQVVQNLTVFSSIPSVYLLSIFFKCFRWDESRIGYLFFYFNSQQASFISTRTEFTKDQQVIVITYLDNTWFNSWTFFPNLT